MATLSGLVQHHKQHTEYSDTFPSESELTVSNWSSSSLGSGHPGQPSLPRCVNEPWPCWQLTAVSSMDQCRPGTPHKSCRFGDALMQTSNHNWASALYDLATVVKMFICCLAYSRCRDEEIISVIYFTCQWGTGAAGLNILLVAYNPTLLQYRFTRLLDWKVVFYKCTYSSCTFNDFLNSIMRDNTLCLHDLY